MSNKKRILITGGAGFIGSHLCRRLLEEGNKVTCLDNFFTGTRENIIDLLDIADFTLVERDVTLILDGIFDEIYNLACPASPVQYQINPVKTFETSVLGAINVLELARENYAKVLQASTSEVYGDPAVHPQREDYWGNVNPVGKRSCYDEGKRSAETLFMDYHNNFGSRIKIIRIFNTYGPHMCINDGRVVSNFIVQALEGKDITIYGDGSQTRSFQYISDLIDGMVRVMATPDSFTGPINIGNPTEFTIRELAEKVIDMTGSKSKIIYEPLPVDDPRQRRPDISLAKQTIDYEPKVFLDEGLKNTIDYFSKLLNKKS